MEGELYNSSSTSSCALGSLDGVKKMVWITLSLQVLTGGRHTLQQGGASLLCSLPDRRLLDALWRSEKQQSDPVTQATGAPAAVLPGLHPRLRQVSSSHHKWTRRWAGVAPSSGVKAFIHPSHDSLSWPHGWHYVTVIMYHHLVLYLY